MMEHTYPRYSNACLGGGGAGTGAGAGGMQPDAGMYMNNVLHGHMEGELGDYGAAAASLGVVGAPNCGGDAPPHEPPPPPAQHKRRRTSNPQSEENFQRALEAVRFGGIGFCKAARMFGVNNRTLWLEYKKKGYPNNRPSIKSRIKREHTTPPPAHDKDEPPPPDHQMALLCPPHPVSVGFIESRPIDFPLQPVPHNSPLNILGVNFNSMQ